MTALKPGLYKATVRGVPDQIVQWHGDTGCTLGPVAEWLQHDSAHITDARPLIILDLDYIRSEPFGLPALLGALHRDYRTNTLALQIEAQTKPARIPEPALWGVVEAAVRGGGQIRFTFIKATNDLPSRWVDIDDGAGADWDDLIDPTLIREGVTE